MARIEKVIVTINIEGGDSLKHVIEGNRFHSKTDKVGTLIEGGLKAINQFVDILREEVGNQPDLPFNKDIQTADPGQTVINGEENGPSFLPAGAETAKTICRVVYLEDPRATADVISFPVDPEDATALTDEPMTDSLFHKFVAHCRQEELPDPRREAVQSFDFINVPGEINDADLEPVDDGEAYSDIAAGEGESEAQAQDAATAEENAVADQEAEAAASSGPEQG